MMKPFDNGISLTVVDYQQMYKNLKTRPVIINHIARDYPSMNASEMINALIRNHYEDDNLDTMARCMCGHLTGGFNEGLVCPLPDCKTVVARSIDRPLESNIWMEVPEGIPAFVNPIAWSIINANMSSTKFDLMQYLTEPHYRPPAPEAENVKSVINYLEANGVKRGLANFYNDFDHIMDVVLVTNPMLKHRNGPNGKPWIKEALVRDMRHWVKKYRKCIFSNRLPFPSRIVFPSEQSGFTTYIDPNMPAAFDSVKTLCSIENSPTRLTERKVNSLVVKTIMQYTAYHEGFRRTTCGTKRGIFRRQLGSTRSPWTARAVIAPLAGKHEYDEIHTPWSMTVALLRVDIASMLMKEPYNMNPREIYKRIDDGTLTYDPLIHEVIDKLIAQCPEGGIPVSMLRNPTLARLSNQIFRITKVITNVNVKAILISVLVIKGPNGDFDGDMLQLKLLRDNKERRMYARFAPHLGIIDTAAPRRIKSIVTHHPEVITMANNFLEKYRTKKEA